MTRLSGHCRVGEVQSMARLKYRARQIDLTRFASLNEFVVLLPLITFQQHDSMLNIASQHCVRTSNESLLLLRLELRFAHQFRISLSL